MNELANANPNSLSRLDTLASEARAYSEAITSNVMQLGRVFCEAKNLVTHGAWGEWVEQNACMSERSAQNVMAIYKRFSDRPMFDGLNKTALFRMLSLPNGTEEQFVQEHDVKGMSSRELEEAVRKVRDEERRKHADILQQLSEAEKARRAAENDLNRVMNAPRTIPQEAMNEIERLKETARSAMDESRQLNMANIKLMNEMQEQQELLEDMQAQYDDAQQKLLNLQSTVARGDVDRTPSDSLSVDTFAGAVRSFVGTCARMPFMSRQFCGMGLSERNEYDELLQVIESWCHDSRKAMNTIVVEGVAK